MLRTSMLGKRLKSLLGDDDTMSADTYAALVMNAA